MIKIIMSLILIVLSLPVSAQINKDYYLQLKNNNKELAIGYYSAGKAKRIELDRLSIDSISAINLKAMLPLDPQKKVLIYFHAMWGNGKGSQKHNLKTFRKIGGPDYQIINIVWKAGGLNYKKNWYRAIETGKILSPVFECLLTNKAGDYNVLCHSMGHRIFEGVLLHSNASFRFNNICFMAADLDADVFSNHLKSLIGFAQNINVYTNHKDRALRFSKKRHRQNRLGLNGLAIGPECEHIKTIDVSKTKAKGSKGITQHLYFKKDRKVLADLQKIFSEKEALRNLKPIDKSLNLYQLF